MRLLILNLITLLILFVIVGKASASVYITPEEITKQVKELTESVIIDTTLELCPACSTDL